MSTALLVLDGFEDENLKPIGIVWIVHPDGPAFNLLYPGNLTGTYTVGEVVSHYTFTGHGLTITLMPETGVIQRLQPGVNSTFDCDHGMGVMLAPGYTPGSVLFLVVHLPPEQLADLEKQFERDMCEPEPMPERRALT